MNEEKFTGKADVYSSHRPGYPEELYDFLFSELGFAAGTAVADVGAGTGIFSLPLAKRGCRVFAVEPNADMRRKAAADSGNDPRFTPVAGSAEKTALPDRSVARATAAQAFHWFDAGAFARECRRILEADGLVVLAYNHRIADDPVTRDTFAANTKHCPAFTGFSGGFRAGEKEKLAAFFRRGDYSIREFRHSRDIDENAFVGRALSSSYAPKPGEAAYDGYVADLKGVFARHQHDGLLESRLESRIYWGTV